ncbi:NADPH-dependent FMN reductase [Gimesia algae]|uniref:FMN-dependent NADPH-azoreductase n=1 Tax=Gimesia algae TaxID=2527971 RepID=A0A517VI43_9PLAN|nr:NAD(P)H-dependent oxidoreductase [Gimesia algae]QDT92658.1 FMN-dependent NADPH-azoreductase [Gimesia algae]
MSQSKILAFAGSTRRNSYNRQVLQVAVAGARAAGADVTVVDLKDYPLPLMNEDLEREEGTPEAATQLKQLFFENDGLLIASPEYNSSITPLLKNTIDWVSRKAEGETPLQAYKGKVAALVSASPGGLGGLRGLVHVRSILSNIQVTVLPTQITISNAAQAFDDEGQLKDASLQQNVENLGKTLAETVSKLTS